MPKRIPFICKKRSHITHMTHTTHTNFSTKSGYKDTIDITNTIIEIYTIAKFLLCGPKKYVRVISTSPHIEIHHKITNVDIRSI
jgi:hypothetical protein